MSEPISATPWDLRSGEKWSIQSVDHDIANDRGNETVVDAKGNVVAYVSGNNDEGGNGQLLKAAPALRDALAKIVDAIGDGHFGADPYYRDIQTELLAAAGAALKQAGL